MKTGVNSITLYQKFAERVDFMYFYQHTCEMGGGQLAPFPSYVETLKFPGPHPVHFPGFSGYFLQREQLGLLVSTASITSMFNFCFRGSSNTDVFTLPFTSFPTGKAFDTEQEKCQPAHIPTLKFLFDRCLWGKCYEG